MKLNEDCIRDVLAYLVENLSIKINGNKGGFNKISLLNVMEHFNDIYSREDIWYSVYNLYCDRFIESDDVQKQSLSGFAFVEIYNVTHRGHQLCESIQPETIWSKTKSVVSKVGVHTLGFIEGIAHDVAVESAKQAVTISMTGNS